MGENIYGMEESIKKPNIEGFSYDVSEYFSDFSGLGYSLLEGVKNSFYSIEKSLYSAASFISFLKSSLPKDVLRVVLTDEQSRKLADGSLKLMSREDGSLMANLINPKNNKIVSTISLEKTSLSPDIVQAMTSYAMQLQIAQIVEQMQFIQVGVEEVRMGQENDRLALAYSCKQKLLQSMVMKNPMLREIALLKIASDSEDSRNTLMLSQNVSLDFLKNQPESIFGKMMPGTSPEKMSERVNEMRENLYAVNMVSFVEAMAYFEMGEVQAAQESLRYYAEYIQKVYLDTEGLVERLDMLDSSPENYWSKTLPDIRDRIMGLPLMEEQKMLEG